VAASKQYKDIVEDLINAKVGEVIPQKHSAQIPGIPKLKFDWSQIVDREGAQLASVGTLFIISEKWYLVQYVQHPPKRIVYAGQH
jgi:hypothetical protein